MNLGAINNTITESKRQSVAKPLKKTNDEKYKETLLKLSVYLHKINK